MSTLHNRLEAVKVVAGHNAATLFQSIETCDKFQTKQKKKNFKKTNAQPFQLIWFNLVVRSISADEQVRT